MNRPVLLTVSGTIPANRRVETDAGRRPRADYVVMASALDAELIDHSNAACAAGPVARLIGKLAGPNAMLAWTCFRRRRSCDVVFTDGEQVGLPYAALTWVARHRPRHVMIAHRLSPRKKVWLHRLLHLQRRVDRVIVYSSAQRDVAVERLHYRPTQVVLMSFMVDTEFWRSEHAMPRQTARPLICAVGQELRDYPTLVGATAELPVDVVLAAASPWSKRKDTTAGIDVPVNVTVASFDPFELRQLYADAAFVVVPLQQNDFQAGITTILEAMAMSRAVICTATEGQTDTIEEGVSGTYVPPGDVAAMRTAVERLLVDPALAKRLGASGREWAIAHADVETYASALAVLARSI